jgi:hypothetical protein
MRLALYLLSAVATALAWIVARRRAEHGPIAWALSIALAADIGRAVLLAWVLPPPNLAPSTPPLEGALRIAIYADRALFAAWPAALAAVALRVLARRPAWPVAIGYVASVAVLVGWYPALRFDALRKAYLAIELAAGFVGFGALVFYRRTKPGKAYVSHP